ncbi:MAG: hypothetical protein ACI37S_06920 [Candidatus Gastranaerophilaceae bacterium]
MNINSVSSVRLYQTPVLTKKESNKKEDSYMTNSMSKLSPQDVQAKYNAYIIQSTPKVSFTGLVEYIVDSGKTSGNLTENMSIEELGSIEDYESLSGYEDSQVYVKKPSEDDPYYKFVLFGYADNAKKRLQLLFKNNGAIKPFRIKDGILAGISQKIINMDPENGKYSQNGGIKLVSSPDCDLRDLLSESLDYGEVILMKVIPGQDYGKFKFRKLSQKEKEQQANLDKIYAKAYITNVKYTTECNKANKNNKNIDNGLKIQEKEFKKVLKSLSDIKTERRLVQDLPSNEIGNIFEYKPLSKNCPNFRIKTPTIKEPYYKCVVMGSEDNYFAQENNVKLDIKDLAVVSNLYYADKQNSKNLQKDNDLLKTAIGKDNYVAFKLVTEDNLSDYTQLTNVKIQNKDFNLTQSKQIVSEVDKYMPLSAFDRLQEVDNAMENVNKIEEHMLSEFDKELNKKPTDLDKEVMAEIEKIEKEMATGDTAENEAYFNELHKHDLETFENELKKK